MLIPSIADRTSSPKTVAGAIFEALDGDGESIAFHSAEGKQSSKGAMDTLSARWIHWSATTLPLFSSRSFDIERRYSDKNSYRTGVYRQACTTKFLSLTPCSARSASSADSKTAAAIKASRQRSSSCAPIASHRSRISDLS